MVPTATGLGRLIVLAAGAYVAEVVTCPLWPIREADCRTGRGGSARRRLGATSEPAANPLRAAALRGRARIRDGDHECITSIGSLAWRKL